MAAPSNPPGVYLVDAMALFYRSFYALMRAGLRNGRGEPTSAIYGFAQAVLRVVETRSIGHMAIVTDSRGPTFRHEIYPEYKAHRPPMPDDLVAQLPLLEELMKSCGVPLIAAPGYEADDLLAAYTHQGVEAGLPVFLMTRDKDLMQLVGPGVRMYDPGRGSERPEEIDEEWVTQKMGVPPHLVGDYLALVGDSSDNIPGVAQIGPKTAVELLTQFGSLDGIYARLEEIAKKAVRARLEAGAESARLSRRLVTLCVDCPVPAPLEALRFSGLDLDGIEAFLERHDIRSLIPQVRKLRLGTASTPTVPGSPFPTAGNLGGAPGDLARTTGGPAFGVTDPFARPASRAARPAGPGRSGPPRPGPAFDLFAAESGAVGSGETAGETGAPGKPTDESDGSAPGAVLAPANAAAGTSTGDAMPGIPAGLNYQLVVTSHELEMLAAALLEVPRFSCDTETTGVDARSCALVGISLAIAPGIARYIPIGHSEGPNADPDEVRRLLGPVLASRSHAIVFHHAKFDLEVLRRFGLVVQARVEDSMIAAYLLAPGERASSLDRQVERRFGHRMIPIEELIGKGRTQTTFDRTSVAAALAYSAEDADWALRLWNELEPELGIHGLWTLYDAVERPLSAVLGRMEEHGVMIDLARLSSLSQEMSVEMERLEVRAHQLAGKPFNVQSPRQLAAILFEDLGLPPVKKTTTGFSTDSEVLEALSTQHELPRTILEHRELAKLKGTYVDVLPTLADPQARVHTRYNQVVAATGRLSSSDPNLQNIPVRGEWGRRIRQAFVAPPGRLLLAADYSQIELRLLAHLSGDDDLRAVYREGRDIHARTASTIFGVDETAVDADMRRKAKVVNFGVVYGMGAFSLSQQLGIARAEAQRFIDGYFAAYPGVRPYIDQVLEAARVDGFVATLDGRKRWIPELHDRNRNIRENAERMAFNTPIQGSAADLIKRAMLAIDAEIEAGRLPARLLLQVHDELVLEVEEKDAEAVGAAVRAMMEGVWTLSVPLVVEVGAARDWHGAHG